MRKRFYLLTIILICMSMHTVNAQVNYVKRVNCGSASSAIYDGNTFDADVQTTGVVEFNGNLTTTGSSYFTLPQPHKSIRYTKNQSMYYKFFVDNGQYQVILHLAEPYHGVAPGTDPETRKFNLDIDGQYSFTDINIMSLAPPPGANEIYFIDRTVIVNDGEITLTFSKGSGNDPIINAIEVLGIDTTDNEPPSAPTVSAAGQSATTVDLSWSGALDNVAVTGYKVYQDGVEIATLGAVNAYQAINLAPQTPYQFKVRALDAAGNESTDSNTVSVTTDSSGGGGPSVWNTSGNDINYTAGKVGIGTANPDYNLTVKGKIHAEEVRVDLSVPGPDYVFKPEYKLIALSELQRYIEKHGHLPNIPSAKEMEAHGVDLGTMEMKLLEKIEELTLYILDQEARIKQLENANN